MKLFVLAALAWTLAAAAVAEPVFPKGGAVGLEPPSAMTEAPNFAGFADPKTGASIVIAELPSEAYAELTKGMTDQELRRAGMTVSRREQVRLKDGPAVIVRGTQAANGITYRKWLLILGGPGLTGMVTVQAPAGTEAALPDAAVETAIGSVVLRAAPSAEAAMDALAFEIGDRAGYRVSRTLVGSAVVLTDGPLDVVKDAAQPLVIVANSFGPAPAAADLDQQAQAAFRSINGLSEMGPIERAPAQEGVSRLQALAVDADTRRPVRVVQVMRTHDTGYVRTVGIARADLAGFPETVTRIADSVRLK